MTTSIPTIRTPRASNVYNAIPNDVYPARLVRFIGLGVQDQPAFDDKPKSPAFKCAVQYELIGVDATGTAADGSPLEPRPSCVFQDYFLFPNATRGKVFDMCRAIDASIEATPKTLEWFSEKIGSLVMVQVGSYQTRDGVTKNKVVAVQPCPGFMKANIGPARSDLVAFNPYVENEVNLAAYNKMFKFQRDMLLEAHDTKNIPFAGREVVVTPAGSPTQSAPTNHSANNNDDEAPF